MCKILGVKSNDFIFQILCKARAKTGFLNRFQIEQQLQGKNLQYFNFAAS